MRWIIAGALALAACRSYPVPNVPQPALDGSVEIKSETAQVKTGTHDVCDGESRCRTEDVTRDEDRSTMLLGGRPITYGQLREIDPQDQGAYGKQLAAYAQRSEPCRTGRKMKIAGIAATVVGGVVALIAAAPTAVRIGGVVVAAGGVGLILLGQSKSSGCDEVYELYKTNQLDLADRYTVADRRKELEAIAARFNSQRGTSGTR